MVDLLDFSEQIKSLYLVRHGDTGATAKGRICGHSDVGLNQEGIYQVELLGAWFSDFKIDSIFSSPLLRAVQTADAIAKSVKIPTYYKHSGLVEKKEGQWEGKTYWEVRDNDSKLWEKWSNDPINFAPPEGESVKDFTARIGRALTDILNNYKTGNNIILTTHAGVIKAIMMNALDIPVENFFRIEIPTASITRIDWSENFATLKYASLTIEAQTYSVA